MALQKQVTSVPFTQGLDTKTDPKLAVKPARLENMVFNGGPLQKRPGRKLFPSTTLGASAQSTGERLFTLDSSLVRINGGSAYELAPSQAEWVPLSGGSHYSILTSQNLVRGTSSQLQYDIVVVNGVAVLAWIEETGSQIGLHVAVYDAQSGAIFQSGAAALASTTTGVVPKCIALGSTVYVWYADEPNLRYVKLSTDAPGTAPSAAATARTDLAINTTFDALTINPNLGFLAYCKDGATLASDIVVITFSPSTAVVASSVKASVAGIAGLQGAGVLVGKDTSGALYVVYGDVDNDRTSMLVVNTSLTTTFGPTVLIASGAWAADGASFETGVFYEVATNQPAMILCTQQRGATVPQLAKITVTASSVVSTSFLASTSALLITSGPVAYDGAVVFGAIADADVTQIQTTAYVIDFSGNVVSRALMSSAAAQFATPFWRVSGSYSSLSGTVATLLFGKQGRLSYSSSLGTLVNTTPVGICAINTIKTSAGALPVRQVGNSVYIGGSLPRLFDGETIAEEGFALYPVGQSFSASGSSGSLSTGTYQWRFLYSWINERGELTRGVVSPAASLSVSATNTASLPIQPMALSMRDILPAGAVVQIEVYRTVANGTVFYRTGSITSPSYNPTGYTAVTITDGKSDADLVSGELLYTTGGVLDWEAPPAYSASCVHNGRLIICGLEDPYKWMPSSPWVPGETVRFSAFESYEVPANTGPLVGCASLDGKLVLFTSQAAYMVIGDGPDNLGNNAYPPPQRITSVEAGPISPVSVTETPMGVFYQSTKGMCLLDRNLSFQFIGADVEQWSTENWIVRCGTVHPLAQQVRFQADPGSDLVGAQMGTLMPSTGGVALVYDYYYNQWSVFASPAIGTGGDYGAQSACLYNGNYAMVRSDGACWLEQPGTWLDNGVGYTSVVETNWIKMAAIQGFQRLYYVEILGTYGSDHTLNWDVAYSYSSSDPDEPTYSESVTFNGSGLLAPGENYEVRHHLGHKCSSVKFRFYDAGITGNGEGMQLSDLTFEYGIKGTAYKLPASRTA